MVSRKSKNYKINSKEIVPKIKIAQLIVVITFKYLI